MLAQTESSLTIKRAPRPYLQPGAVVAIAAGEYAVTSAHTGLSMGSQRFGRGSYVSQGDVVTRWQIVGHDGGYLIRAEDGALTEGQDDYVRLGDGTTWTLRAVEGSDLVEICAPSGRVLEADWRKLAGTWVRLAERTGASNQEWRISGLVTDMVRQPAETARVKRTILHMGRSSSLPSVSWQRDGETYLYRVRVAGMNLTWLWLNKGADYDAVEVSRPSGWQFAMRGWFAAKPARGGDFVLRSTYAPGPVIVSATAGAAGGILYRGDESYAQTVALGAALLARGSHAWSIGPAIAPGTDEAGIRALVKAWTKDGLAFLWPLLDQGRPLAEELRDVQPGTEFEAEALRCIAAAAVK